jgi:hypothetical protein
MVSIAVKEKHVAVAELSRDLERERGVGGEKW